MIKGPAGTPYEDGIFLFDLQLPQDYPKSPPKVHYLSFCSGKLNPNLYENGFVCVSLLGTWSGKGSEKWTNDSNLCQLIVSLQGMVLFFFFWLSTWLLIISFCFTNQKKCSGPKKKVHVTNLENVFKCDCATFHFCLETETFLFFNG